MNIMTSNLEQSILAGTSVKPEFEEALQNAYFHKSLGFLAVSHEALPVDPGETVLLGWANSGWQRGTVAAEEEFTGVTDILGIDPDLRTVARQGKGTGARAYNTPQALAGAAEDMEAGGLYAFAVNLDRLGDKRYGAAQQRVRSVLGQKVLPKLLGGAEYFLTINDQKTEVFDGVLYNQTPDGKKQKTRKGVGESPVPEQFMVVRRPNTTFVKIGEYTY
jgi:hypothetical protein